VVRFLINSLVLVLPVVALWVIFWGRMEKLDSAPRPYREGEVRPWEREAEERAERRRVNAMMEEELMRRAA